MQIQQGLFGFASCGKFSNIPLKFKGGFMDKKTLEEKIKYVCWWAFGLTILYFMVGARLISDGTKFDPAKTYNLLKDTLTLAAAFLAPVAAIILFSDWKEQYFQTKIEKDAQCIYEDVVNYLTLLHKLERLVQEDKLNNDRYQKVIDYRDGMRPASDELKRKIIGFKAQSEYGSESGLNFYNKSKEIYICLNSAAGGVRTLITGFEKSKNGEEYIQKTANFQEVLFSDIYDNLDEIAEDIILLSTYKSQAKAKSD